MIGAGASRQRGDIVAYGEKRNILTEFNSNNTHILNVEETKAKIAALAYIQEELAKWEK